MEKESLERHSILVANMNQMIGQTVCPTSYNEILIGTINFTCKYFNHNWDQLDRTIACFTVSSASTSVGNGRHVL